MADEVTKVGGQTKGGGDATGGDATTTGGDAKAKKETKKIEFPIADAMYTDKEGNVVSAVNADGFLIAVPKPIRDADKKVIYTGFNIRKHIPLKKAHFAGICELILFQAFVSRVKAAILLKGAEDKEKKAARIAKFGDDATRRKVNKLAKMKEMIEKLQKGLEEDGVDLSDLDD